MAFEGITKAKESTNVQVKVKCMLVCFFDSMGIVHKEWVPAGQTVSQYYYKDILERLKESHTVSSKHCHKLNPSPRQCASPCSILCSAVFDIQRHYGDSAASLLT